MDIFITHFIGFRFIFSQAIKNESSFGFHWINGLGKSIWTDEKEAEKN